MAAFGRSDAGEQGAKVTPFATGNEADVREKRFQATFPQ
jgi:hypothetical protein